MNADMVFMLFMVVILSMAALLDTNPYVFARLNADTPLTGNKELKDIATECPGLKHADRIKSTSLRRYIATVSQVCLRRHSYVSVNVC